MDPNVPTWAHSSPSLEPSFPPNASMWGAARMKQEVPVRRLAQGLVHDEHTMHDSHGCKPSCTRPLPPASFHQDHLHPSPVAFLAAKAALTVLTAGCMCRRRKPSPQPTADKHPALSHLGGVAPGACPMALPRVPSGMKLQLSTVKPGLSSRLLLAAFSSLLFCRYSLCLLDKLGALESLSQSLLLGEIQTNTLLLLLILYRVPSLSPPPPGSPPGLPPPQGPSSPTKSQRLLAAALIPLFTTSALLYSTFHQLRVENANSVGWPPGGRQPALPESVMKGSCL